MRYQIGLKCLGWWITIRKIDISEIPQGERKEFVEICNEVFILYPKFERFN